MRSMRFKVVAIVAAISALAFAFGLVGCGINEKNFVGTYTLTEMKSSSQNMSESDLKALQAYGFSFQLTLKEDHTATLSLVGESTSGTWKATSNEAGEMTLNSLGSGSFTLKNGKLTMESGTDKLVFTKNV